MVSSSTTIKVSRVYTFKSSIWNSFSCIRLFSVCNFCIWWIREAVGGLVDQTENANKTFPKGIKISAIVIGVGYSLAILMVGLFTNWQEVLSNPDVRMANVAYVVIKNLVLNLEVFGLSPHGIEVMGNWFARYIGLAMFLALLGAFFTLIYSPLKQLIEGTPKEICTKMD